MTGWPFEDPPNLAVIVDKGILREGKWIARVSHDIDDGGWQFHTDEVKELQIDDGAVVGLSEMVDLDRSLMELADLPMGWRAWRLSKNAPWQRAKAIAQ